MILSNTPPLDIQGEKALQECTINAKFSQGSILGPALFPLYINDLLYDAVSNITIYANDWDPVSKLWYQLESASKLESDLQDTVVWGRKYEIGQFIDFKEIKTPLVSFDCSENWDATDLTMNGSNCHEKLFFQGVRIVFLS